MNLTEAVSYAIEQDTIHRSDDIDKELLCSYCNFRGHKSESCGKKEKAIRASNLAAGFQNAKTCNKCGFSGHTQIHCHVRTANPNGQARMNNANYIHDGPNINRPMGQNHRNNYNQRNNYNANRNNQNNSVMRPVRPAQWYAI